MNATLPATPAPDWRGTFRKIAMAALLWALAASILYLVVPGIETYGRLLLHAECNGLSIVIIFMLMQRLRWVRAQPTGVGWFVAGAVALPAGFMLGHIIAFRILGEPMRMFQPGPFMLVPVWFTILVAAGALYYFWMQERLAREAAVRSAAQLLAAESQLRMLRAQLEPHMLFNTLANLRSLLSEDPAKAEVMIDRLIVYLRSALAASRSESTTLASEFGQLAAYLEIMSIRMGTRLSYRLDLPPALADTRIPPMLLQPIVENAIKHGIEPKVGPGSIEVLASNDADCIRIQVNDSGLGLPPDHQQDNDMNGSGGSYGLVHVRERLATVYGDRATLTISPRRPTGVSAEIRLPA